MATRLNARDEKVAALCSIMNVLSILDQEHPRPSGRPLEVDLRTLLPVLALVDEETWGTGELYSARQTPEALI
jgi:hypothetical protein